jgi:hypothetical protein
MADAEPQASAARTALSQLDKCRAAGLTFRCRIFTRFGPWQYMEAITADSTEPASTIDRNAVYSHGSSAPERAVLDRTPPGAGEVAIDVECGPRGILEPLSDRVGPSGRDPQARQRRSRAGGCPQHRLASSSVDVVHARTFSGPAGEAGRVGAQLRARLRIIGLLPSSSRVRPPGRYVRLRAFTPDTPRGCRPKDAAATRPEGFEGHAANVEAVRRHADRGSRRFTFGWRERHGRAE